MNGEILQSCRIVAAAKQALEDKKPIYYEPVKYENSIVFDFIPKKTLFKTKPYKAINLMEWYDKCISQGLLDIKLLAPITVKDRNLLGFSNASQISIACFYKEGKVTYFTAHWNFNDTLKHWDITYTEHAWENPPQGKPQFQDNSEMFAKILNKIEIFARDIGSYGFADRFNEAKTILLDGAKDSTEIGISLPAKNINMFIAANKADVFGAMGSWNDSPPFMAHEKGLDSSYDELSAELLKQLRLAILFAINEW